MASGRQALASVLAHAQSAGIDFECSLFLALGYPAALTHILEAEARKAQVGLIQTAIACGALKPAEFYGKLSQMLAFAGECAPYRVHLPGAPLQAWLLLERPMPLAADGEAAVAVNAQNLPIQMLVALSQKLGTKARHLKLITRQELIDSVTRSHGRVLVQRAVAGLMKARPEWSAKTGLAAWQAYFAAVAGGFACGGILVSPREALTLSAFGLSLFFLLAIVLRLAALLNLLLPRKEKQQQQPLLRDSELPRYTVFVPLYKEVDILPHLAKALSKLDYPPAKLDIKIVLEAVDTATIEAAAALHFPGNVDLIVVPDRQPRTKPKALNYALQFATGDLAVIYDAEDRPEPDQLRKAATQFHRASPDVACLQARLDYFNASENWLSRQFTIEYATLFRGLLPLFSRFGLPLPLGGTSNHFRIGVLRELGAWDPYNVTEDADLGMRLHRAGYRAETLDSTTYEEACCKSVPWVKQRTRWLKGWMQTFGVHMRAPLATLRETGLTGFLTFHAYFAGIIVSSLAHPLFYLVLAHDALQGTLFKRGATLQDDILLAIAVTNFIAGYGVNVALGAASLTGSRHKGLWLHAIFIPVYWLYVSAAAYRASWQLVWAPFYWEKTEHGVSRVLQPAKGPEYPAGNT
jgi:hypothetical protein